MIFFVKRTSLFFILAILLGSLILNLTSTQALEEAPIIQIILQEPELNCQDAQSCVFNFSWALDYEQNQNPEKHLIPEEQLGFRFNLYIDDDAEVYNEPLYTFSVQNKQSYELEHIYCSFKFLV